MFVLILQKAGIHILGKQDLINREQQNHGKNGGYIESDFKYVIYM